jgi:hypothetical protein
MAQVKFKDESERIIFAGRHEELNSANLTWEKYEWIMQKHPMLADKFIVIEDEKKAKKEDK